MTTWPRAVLVTPDEKQNTNTTNSIVIDEHPGDNNQKKKFFLQSTSKRLDRMLNQKCNQPCTKVLNIVLCSDNRAMPVDKLQCTKMQLREDIGLLASC